jgi:hypothetical protein
MKGTFRALAPEFLSRRLVLCALVGLASVAAEAQYAAEEKTMTSPPKQNWTFSTTLPKDLDPLRGSHWGRGGPWADQDPHTPRPKPPGWVDPELSRWPWTGERDPYDYPNRNQLNDVRWLGQGPQTPVSAMPAYRGPPPP